MTRLSIPLTVAKLSTLRNNPVFLSHRVFAKLMVHNSSTPCTSVFERFLSDVTLAEQFVDGSNSPVVSQGQSQRRLRSLTVTRCLRRRRRRTGDDVDADGSTVEYFDRGPPPSPVDDPSHPTPSHILVHAA